MNMLHFFNCICPYLQLCKMILNPRTTKHQFHIIFWQSNGSQETGNSAVKPTTFSNFLRRVYYIIYVCCLLVQFGSNLPRSSISSAFLLYTLVGYIYYTCVEICEFLPNEVEHSFLFYQTLC